MRIQHSPIPKYGSERYVKRFAWFPISVDNKTLWLETYYTRETYGTLDFTCVDGWNMRERLLPEVYEAIMQMQDRR